DEKYRLVVSQGEILDAEELPALEMPYGFFRPDTGVRTCMDAWLQAGGPHHQVLNRGHVADAWREFCQAARIEMVVVYASSTERIALWAILSAPRASGRASPSSGDTSGRPSSSRAAARSFAGSPRLVSRSLRGASPLAFPASESPRARQEDPFGAG